LAQIERRSLIGQTKKGNGHGERTYYRCVLARKRVVAGNWKMNCTLAEARSLAQGIVEQLGTAAPSADAVVCPPFTALAAVAEALQGSTVGLGGQNMYFEEKGAFTGEISAAMLLD